MAQNNPAIVRNNNGSLLFLLKSALIVFFFCGTLPASRASVLDQRISVNFANTALLDAFSQIEKLAGVTFSFKSDDISQQKRVNLRLSNTKLDFVLSQLFANQPVGYKAIGTQIILYKAVRPPQARTTAAVVRDTVRIQLVDSIRVVDTVRVAITDTLHVRVYDTIRISQPVDKPTQISPAQFLFQIDYSFMQGRAGTSHTSPLTEFSQPAPRASSIALSGGLQRGRLGLTLGAGWQWDAQRYDVLLRAVTVSTERVARTENYTVYDSSYYVLAPLDTVWHVDTLSRQRTVYDHVARTDTAERAISGKKSVQSFLVPVAVAYSIFENGRVQLVANAGLVFGFTRTRNGYYYKTDIGTVVSSESVNFAPVTCTGMLSIGAGYRIGTGLFVCLAPSVSYRLSPLGVDDTILSESPLRYGISIGIKKMIKNF